MANTVDRVVINGVTYNLKDSDARSTIADVGGWIVSTNAGTTPYGVQWDNNGTVVTGTLEAASANNKKIYLVLSEHSSTGDIYSEWIAIQKNSTYSWEELGETRFTGTIDTTTASAVSALVSSAHYHSVTPGSMYIGASASGGSVVISAHTHTVGATHKYIGASVSGATGTSTNGDHTHTIGATSRYLTITQVSGASVGVSTGSFNVSYGDVLKGFETTPATVYEDGIYSASLSISIPNASASLETKRFSKVNALTSSTSITITGVASRTSATVATGGTTTGTTFVTGIGTADGTTLVTSVTPATYQRTLFNGSSSSTTASNYIQSISSGTVTKKSVVTGLGSAMMASYRSSDEALVLTLATAASAEYGVDGNALASVTATYRSFSVSDTTATGVSMTKRDFTKAGLATTTVYSANEPTSISATVSGTTEVIGTATSNSGVVLGTSLNYTDITIYPASEKMTFVTGFDGDLISKIESTSAPVVNAITGTSTFLTGAYISSQQTNKIFVSSSSTSNAALVITGIDSTTGASGGHDHTIGLPTVTLASYTSSSTGRVKYAASVPENTGSAGNETVAISTPPTITLSSLSKAQSGSVVVASPETASTTSVSTVVSGSTANYVTDVRFS